VATAEFMSLQKRFYSLQPMCLAYKDDFGARVSGGVSNIFIPQRTKQMDLAAYSKSPVLVHQTAWRYKPEDGNFEHKKNKQILSTIVLMLDVITS
jgi:hypothetical protein